MSNKIEVVIGSWGSYNECNERALGSSWIDLDDFTNSDEIIEELKRQGFELEDGGIDEELFIQDIDTSLNTSGANFDNMGLREIDLIYESGILDEDYKFRLASAYIEVTSFDEWLERVEENGSDWDDCINLYWEDTLAEMIENNFEDFYPGCPDNLRSYIDFESIARDWMIDGRWYETDEGLLEIYY